MHTTPDFSTIDTLVFDLGGVIINIDFDLTFGAFAAIAGTSLADTKKRMEAEQLWEAIELGNLSEKAFYAQIRQVFDVDASDEALRKAWCAILKDIPKERVALLQQLRKKYRLYLLSNTSPAHIAGVNNILYRSSGVASLEELFDKTYYSSDLGLRKPDITIYNQVAHDAGLDGQRTLFADDNEANLRGAEKAGWQTVLVTDSRDILTIFAHA